jgi:hypothetical protein
VASDSAYGHRGRILIDHRRTLAAMADVRAISPTAIALRSNSNREGDVEPLQLSTHVCNAIVERSRTDGLGRVDLPIDGADVLPGCQRRAV